MAKRKPTSVAYAADESGNPITGSTAVAELPTANAVVDDLRETDRVVSEAELSRYRELVIAVADGRKFDESEKADCRQLLKSIGRRLEDLAADAETLREIRRLRGVVGDYEENNTRLMAEARAAKQRWQEAEAQLAAARDANNKASWAVRLFSQSAVRLRQLAEQFAERCGGDA